MLRNEDVYHRQISDPYERLISCEDYLGNIPRTLQEIADFRGKVAVDLGAGTGRLSRMVAPYARKVIAVDFAPDMLRIAAEKLQQIDPPVDWSVHVSDMRHIPLEDQAADIVMAGWSLCYLASSNNPDWEQNLARVMAETERVLRDGGAVIILETLGTGNEEPGVYDFLQNYFDQLTGKYGFQHKSIRTDYRFDSVQEAAQMAEQFFGESVGRQVLENGSRIVPECTGVWWKTVRKSFVSNH